MSNNNKFLHLPFNKSTMSIANTIPEELITKITIMSYQLHPHPLATILKDKELFIDNINKLIEDKYNLYQKIADVPNLEYFKKSFMYADLSQEIARLTYYGKYNKSGIIKEINRNRPPGDGQAPIPKYLGFNLYWMTIDNGWDLTEDDGYETADEE